MKPSIEFVVLSAYNEFQLVREFFQMGIFDYITKIDLDSPQTAQVLSRLRLSVMKKSVVSNKDAVVEFLRASAIQRYPKADKIQFVLFNFSLSDKTNLQKFRKFTNFLKTVLTKQKRKIILRHINNIHKFTKPVRKSSKP